ncbi:sulfite exporter TauE/SafE family protein [Actinomyces sp. ZJ308]|uniref:sulfite exporter TauE/SafE family protein n=1 Tax=Actinomyces sp. ZJ308 TaxID=2708342 RepID=UPI00141F75BD|nr:sulfite exporter TauE/SafE family protein [Actinomyces sp. ZJ308]
MLASVLTALAVGVLVGVVVGALGAGGGILSVPALVYLLGQDPHDASAGSLVVVGLTAIVSLIAPARAGRVHWRDGLTFGLMSVLGALVGSRASVAVNGTVLLTLFSAMLAVVGVIMLVRGLRSRSGPDGGSGDGCDGGGGAAARRGLLVIAGAATFTGFLTGFFGVGGGFIVVPMLVLALGFPMKEASGTSLLVMIIASAAGLAARVGTHSNVDWPVVLVFAAASMAGGLLGGPLTRRASAATLTTVFGVLLLGVCAVTAYDLLTA